MNSTHDSNRQRRHFADHEKVAILKRHAIAFFLENDVPFIHAGDKAEVEIHAFPGKKIASRVARIASAWLRKPAL